MSYSRVIIFLTLGLGAASSGCAPPHVTIRHPLTAGGSLPPSEIVQANPIDENLYGLRPGSMADKATLERVDAEQVCINVTLRELGQIDLAKGRLGLSAGKYSVGAFVVGPSASAKIQPQPLVTTVYNGRLPRTKQTGTTSECRAVGETVQCQTQPTSSTVWVPDHVTVFTAAGRLCAPNHGFVTPATEMLDLSIQVPVSEGVHHDKWFAVRWEFAK